MPTAKGKSREKGKRVEREAVHFLRWCGFEARRGQQHKGSPDSPDVECESLPHLEITSRSDIDLGTKVFDEKMAQAAEDAPSDCWLMLWKPTGKGWRLSWMDGMWGVPVTVAGAERIRQVLIKMASD